MFVAVEPLEKTKRYWQEWCKRGAVNRRNRNKSNVALWMNSENIYNRKNTQDEKRWMRIKYLAKKRDRFQCQKCEEKNNLEVHHKIPVHAKPGLQYTLGNLITLCKKCHKKLHNDWKIVKYDDIKV